MIKLTAKCIMGHTETLSEVQIKEAKYLGVAICSTCGNPTMIRKATHVPNVTASTTAPNKPK